jgi:hypothetical protein
MPTVNGYDKGNLIRVTGTFTDSAGAAIDPTVVLFAYYASGATPTVLTYPTDGALAKDGPGIYHVDVSLTTSGPWYYRFYSTGTGQAASEWRLLCNVSNF